MSEEKPDDDTRGCGILGLLGCGLVLLVCGGVPLGLYWAVSSGAINRLGEAIDRDAQLKREAQDRALEARLAALAQDPTQTDRQAIEAIAAEVFSSQSSLWTVESVLLDGDKDNRSVHLVVQERDARQKVGLADRLPDPLALRVVAISHLARASGQFAKHARHRGVRQLNVLLQFEVYVNDHKQEYVDMYEFDASPEQVDGLVEIYEDHAAAYSIAMFEEHELPWTVEQDNFSQLEIERKSR